ncbi:MAG: protein kinase [Minicystis sp.]
MYAQLCHALAAAHAAGVVHRDLKPENIFLAASHREGSTFTVKVLDFGIAKVAAEAKTSSTAAIGTPLWMAPEQTAAHSTVGPQTDVWALGLIAFRMLTGRVYWVAANDENANTASLMREILFEPVIPASERAAQLGVAGLLPPGFDSWFGCCVHREMNARYPNAAEARAGLAALLGGFTPAPSAVQSAQQLFATAPVAHLVQGQTPPPGQTVAGAPPGVSAFTSPQAPMGLPSQPTPAAPPQVPYNAPPSGPQMPPGPQMPHAQQMPYGAPPPGAVTPQGMSMGPAGAAKPQPKKGAPIALIGGGIGLVVLALGVFGVSKMRAARARNNCEQNAPTATTANGTETADACKRACSDKPGEACILHGDLVQRLKLGDDREEVARADYDKACDADEMRGCRRAAALAERKDTAKAATLYTKACDHGDAPACSGLGVLHELGAGVARDRTRAASYYDKACSSGDALGCAYKSFMLGAGRGIKQDEARAAELAKSALPGLSAACEHGEARECVALAVLLGNDKKEEGRAAQLEQQACDAGEPAGCANLGVRTLLGAGVFKDAKRGMALLKEACDAGEPSACTNVGVLSARAAFTIRREVRGVAAFKLACDGIYSVGCSGWGLTIPPLADIPKDAPAAVAMSTRACDGGELVGCVNLGAFHQYAVGTERNREKASDLFKKACEGGDAGGCGELGTMYATGRGVPFDGRRGMELFNQACEWGERDACAVIGDLKQSGIGAPKAPEEGTGIFKTYCEKHNLAMACNAYANSIAQGRGAKKDVAGAVALLKQVCDGKKDRIYPSGCVSLGNIFEAGLAGQKDLPAAAKLYQAACDAGTISACSNLARLLESGLGVPKDAAKARALVEEGCKSSDPVACDQLAYFHTMGKAGLPANGKEGIKYFQQACDDASWGSCSNIGYIYLFGLAGVAKDKAKAAEYLKLACSHGEDGACQKIKENAM